MSYWYGGGYDFGGGGGGSTYSDPYVDTTYSPPPDVYTPPDYFANDYNYGVPDYGVSQIDTSTPSWANPTYGDNYNYDYSYDYSPNSSSSVYSNDPYGGGSDPYAGGADPYTGSRSLGGEFDPVKVADDNRVGPGEDFYDGSESWKERHPDEWRYMQESHPEWYGSSSISTSAADIAPQSADAAFQSLMSANAAPDWSQGVQVADLGARAGTMSDAQQNAMFPNLAAAPRSTDSLTAPVEGTVVNNPDGSKSIVDASGREVQLSEADQQRLSASDDAAVVSRAVPGAQIATEASGLTGRDLMDQEQGKALYEGYGSGLKTNPITNPSQVASDRNPTGFSIDKIPSAGGEGLVYTDPTTGEKMRMTENGPIPAYKTPQQALPTNLKNDPASDFKFPKIEAKAGTGGGGSGGAGEKKPAPTTAQKGIDAALLALLAMLAQKKGGASEPSYGVPNMTMQRLQNAVRGGNMGQKFFGNTTFQKAGGGMVGYADGGIMSGLSLGGYSDGGRLLRGPGDGVSDSIPARIGAKQEARLADGEFVVPARIVSELGNGSTDAGARKLYEMMNRVQNARKKTVGKDSVAVNSRAARHLPK